MMHPQDHPGQYTGCYQHGDPFKDLFSTALKLHTQHVEHQSDQQACQNRNSCAHPDLFVQINSIQPEQYPEYNSNNKGRF